MRCDLCDHWFHAACLNISDDKYRKLSQLKDCSYWFCEDDLKKFKTWKNHESKKIEIEKTIVNIEKEVMLLKNKLETKSAVPSYANVLKHSELIPADKPKDCCGLLIYPKDKSNTSHSTEQKIREAVNLPQMKIE